MKTFLRTFISPAILVIMLGMIMFAAPLQVQANDYLEHFEHYTVRGQGQGVLRFCIPVWVYGVTNDYYLCDQSYLWYEVDGNRTSFAKIYAKAYGKNDETDDVGEGYIQMMKGTAIVKSCYDGLDRQYNEGGTLDSLYLKRKNDDGHKYITYFEFDWYVPGELDGKNFKVGIYSYVKNKRTGGLPDGSPYTWEWSETFTGNSILQSPELFSPYLYSINESGAAGYGYAAIPYATYQKPNRYNTSFDGTTNMCASQAGNLFVATTDMVQRNFYANFEVYRDENLGTLQWLKSNSVNIPAYHRPYNLQASEVMDDHQSLTGLVQIQWEVHNPAEEDLMDGDYFELQRATQADFSDAETITLTPFSADSSVYHFIDDVRSLGGNYAIKKIDEKSFYDIMSPYGFPITFQATLSSYVPLPGLSLYYRVRRASASVWGWDNHEFVLNQSLHKNSHLAPLSQQQPDYVLDKDFADNRTIHFNIKIDNELIEQQPTPEEDCEFKFELSEESVDNYKEINDYKSMYAEAYYKENFTTVPIKIYLANPIMEIQTLNMLGYGFEDIQIILGFYNSEGQRKDIEMAPNDFLYQFTADIPTGSKDILVVVYLKNQIQTETQIYQVVPYSMSYSFMSGGFSNRTPDYTSVDWTGFGNYIKSIIEEYYVSKCPVDSLRHALYENQVLPHFTDADIDTLARCMWDRNATIILTKNMTDMDMKSDIIVSPDSVRRQDDGSWVAHITDVADAPCTHYEYSVRLDPSHALMKLRTEDQTNPVSIHGPDLYTVEAAKVNTFTATQGTDKQGVLLYWEPTTGGMTDYVLLRRDHGTEAAFDTLLVSEDAGYRDLNTIPDKHYDYKLAIRYTCNGNLTETSAITEGWRSPYGSISGRVFMSDGSGNAGINVTISKGESVVKVLKTKADGTYLADSLRYDADGTSFTVTPTSQYGVFTYNNTSSALASVTLSIERSEATGIDFENTASVRLTGRVLYENTTIPVAEAQFLLNGNLVSLAGSPVKTMNDGTFSMQMPKAPVTLQVVKDGHHFSGDGYLRINGDSIITLDKPLDGVRFWDETTVRLVGRMAGGNDQGKLPLGFGLSKNNLGDNLQLVMELEGDNISYFIHYPSDPTITERDTTFQHPMRSEEGVVSAGSTNMHITQKRLSINPDPVSGEFEVDIWPVRYKITQATATGYATLFPNGAGSETIDLTNAVTEQKTEINATDTVNYNAVYKRIYHSPVVLSLIQRNYGVDSDYYGDEKMVISSLVDSTASQIRIVDRAADGSIRYLFGHPVFHKAIYTYRAWAYEEYYYNNDSYAGKRDRVNMHGGTLKVHNGLHSGEDIAVYQIDNDGHADFNLTVDDPEFVITGDSALRTVSVVAEIENDFIAAEPLKAFVTGNRIDKKDMHAIDADIDLLDILRDPPGSGSSTYLDEGAKYNHSFNVNFDVKFGLNIDLKWGTSVSNVVGTWLGVGAGTFAGSPYTTSKQTTIPIPISINYKGSYTYGYNISTTSKISTSSATSKVGSKADVFFGVNKSVVYGFAKAIRIIDKATWDLRKPARDQGTLKLVAEGQKDDGTRYYLVIGQETVLGADISNTFTYTQDYIIKQEMPKLLRERDELLLSGDSATVQAIANATGQPQYWSHPSSPEKTGLTGQYTRLMPEGHSEVLVDRVALYNNIIKKWTNILWTNEKQKIEARQRGRKIGTWSVSGGTTRSYSENFDYSFSASYQPTGVGSISGSSLSNLFKESFTNEAAEKLYEMVELVLDEYNNMTAQPKEPSEVLGEVPGMKFSVSLTPIFNADVNSIINSTETHSKTMGFTLAPASSGFLTTSIYCYKDSLFAVQSETYQNVTIANDSITYGSFVFFTEAGASVCPHEAEEVTKFYNTGTLLNNGTLKVEEPRIAIDVHERSNVPADKAAIFNLRLSNEGQLEGAGSATFTLTQPAESNPHGAKIFIDGMPVTGNDMEFSIARGQAINKVMEVYRGEVDDYENLQLNLTSTTCGSNEDNLLFSVHFLPSSSDVEISSPHDKWTMNTFSAHDSIGYYIPVTIEGFDINHRGFDHIEFQYKLSTQSDDSWVNQCSFYADKDLFDAATGNKEMITNGRISTLRFYGERDPMEQQYDLRAVTFCRHGSGFVTKASKVLSGIKDTRPPRVFGQPKPANSILGVDDDIRLRFSEPIAGNYLDEDNNFQIMGVTNNTGITATTSLSFDGTSNSYAATKVERNLSGKPFSIDMLVRPANPDGAEVFFTHGENGEGIVFGKTSDNRLYAKFGNSIPVKSQPLPDKMTAFTRVILTFNNETAQMRFYAGTLDITDNSQMSFGEGMDYNICAPLCFGKGFAGNMLEARLWTKVLTPEDIATTHLKRLTGYERKLAAYYPMNEGKGEALTDRANGATLYSLGTSWTLPDGISMKFDGASSLTLDQDVMSRAAVEDYTLMLWFRTEKDGTIFSAGYTSGSNTSKGTLIAIENGLIVFRNGKIEQRTKNRYDDNNWHHLVISVNRTYNTAEVYVDTKLCNSFASENIGALGGVMRLGATPNQNGTLDNYFTGHMDELVLFEQALPKSLVEAYDNIAPYGDEMGLIAYLPFEEEKENPNGVMESVFSINNRRTFKDSNGNVIDKVQPLVISDKHKAESMVDHTNDAPARDRGMLTKLNFGWAYNVDELLIDINMQDKEINKNNIYLTVRNVEDLNGNRMVSPIMWQAFVDRNSLKWEKKQLSQQHDYADLWSDNYCDIEIHNHSGVRHQYTIEQIPDWLTIDEPYGSLDPTDEKTLRFTFASDIAVGVYSDLIYLTDENGLSEPLHVVYTIQAKCPWDEVDRTKYQLNMSVCGQVMIRGAYDTDPEDKVIALYRNECIGMASISSTNDADKMDVYLTIYGNDELKNKSIIFKLWQASTGKVFNLSTDREIKFVDGNVLGCGNESPVQFTASGSETQNLTLNAGWTWTSFNILVAQDATGVINNVMTAAKPWSASDLIKNPATQNFCIYSDSLGSFVGSLVHFYYIYTHMIYCENGNTMRVIGDALPTDSMRVTLRGGRWNPLPCLLNEATSVTEALSDYYYNALAGDLIKSHDRFATFSQDGRWVGDLTTIRPGEGYFFKRIGEGDVVVHFYNKNYSVTPPMSARRAPLHDVEPAKFTNPNAMTNMTMIAKIDDSKLKSHASKTSDLRVLAYCGSELAGIAQPQIIDGDTLLFITIAPTSPANGTNSNSLIFRLEDKGEIVGTTSTMMPYSADAHYGSPQSPVPLKFESQLYSTESYPARVRIYSATGQLIEELNNVADENKIYEWLNTAPAAGVYNAVIIGEKQTKTIKLIKK